LKKKKNIYILKNKLSIFNVMVIFLGFKKYSTAMEINGPKHLLTVLAQYHLCFFFWF